jgi:hypothetical protein
MDFGYYALLVDKARVHRDSGLQYKQSFYKFLNRLLYQRLAGGVQQVQVVADRYGGRNFMDSFRPYLDKKGLPNLFTSFTHEFADSAKEPLIQLADLIAGSLAYVLDPKKRSDQSQAILKALRPKQIGIGGWPLLPVAKPEDFSDDEQDWDERIGASCINCAGSAGTGERAFSVSEYSALRAGIFQASGSTDPMAFGRDAERCSNVPFSSSR